MHFQVNQEGHVTQETQEDQQNQDSGEDETKVGEEV